MNKAGLEGIFSLSQGFLQVFFDFTLGLKKTNEMNAIPN